MTTFVEEHREAFEVEPICRELEIAPSTYYAAKSRPPSARAVRDAELKPEIERVFDQNYRVYGARKVWLQLRREGIDVGRDRVARLMDDLGICGVVRGKKKRTTIPDPSAPRAPDLVARDWAVGRPTRLWVGLHAGGHVVGCGVRGLRHRLLLARDRRLALGHTMRTALVLDALEMAI